MAKKEDELNFETDNNKMASSEKLKALQAAMDKIEKKSYMAVLIWVLYVQLSLSMKRELSNGSSDPKK